MFGIESEFWGGFLMGGGTVLIITFVLRWILIKLLSDNIPSEEQRIHWDSH